MTSCGQLESQIAVNYTELHSTQHNIVSVYNHRCKNDKNIHEQHKTHNSRWGKEGDEQIGGKWDYIGGCTCKVLFILHTHYFMLFCMLEIFYLKTVKPS